MSRPSASSARSVPAARRAAAIVAACAAALSAAGCSTAPVAHFHTLLAPLPAAAPALPDDARAVAWTLAPVLVPPQVERPQWVVRAPGGTLAVLENERWIAPVADEIRAAVAERLQRTLGIEGRLPDAGRTGWRLAINVQRFDSQPAHAALLTAVWTIAPAREPDDVRLTCRSAIEQPVGPGYPALAAGHRQALVRLADALGPATAALDRGEVPRCTS